MLARHGGKAGGEGCGEWGCKALVALSTLPANKAMFLTTEACSAVVGTMQALHQEPIVAGKIHL